MNLGSSSRIARFRCTYGCGTTRERANSLAGNIRRVWPARGGEIVARGGREYWQIVDWFAREGMTADVVGTVTNPDGQSLYLLEFQHRGKTLFYAVEQKGVVSIKE